MPVATAESLHELLMKVFIRAGVPEDRAETVTQHLVEANLVGHDSHGAIRALAYVDLIKKGKIKPDAPIEVVDDQPCTAVIDGHWGLGFVVTKFAIDLAIEKARKFGVAAVTIRQQSHMGRLGWYAARAAEAGMIALVTADSGQAPKWVAPHGGRSRRLGPNPLAMAVPADVGGPVVLDMATSTVAHGKVKLAIARGEEIPHGWVIDADGNATHDPSALHKGGALLPFGADQAHKGYGLSFMVEALSGVLTGIGYSHDPGGFANDGSFIALFEVSRFRDRAAFGADMKGFITYLKESPLAAGYKEIFYPGEIEHRTLTERAASGVFIEEKTWEALVALSE